MKKIIITLISTILFVSLVYISLVLFYYFKSEKIIVLEPKGVSFQTDRLHRYKIDMNRDCIDINVGNGFNYLSFYIYFEDDNNKKIDVSFNVNSNVVSFKSVDYDPIGQKYKLVSHVNILDEKIVICFLENKNVKNFVIDYPLAEIR